MIFSRIFSDLLFLWFIIIIIIIIIIIGVPFRVFTAVLAYGFFLEFEW